MFRIFRYPDDDGPMIHVANLDNLNAVLDWFTQRQAQDPDGHQHIVTHGGRVIGVEAGDNGRLVMIH
jgi:hypothetical protein